MFAHRMLLMRLGILDALSDEQVSMVQQNLQIRWLALDEALFRQGERCEHLHLVQDGSLQLLSERGGHSCASELVMPGQTLGEIGVFLGMPYPCSAIAAEDTLIASLHREPLQRMIERVPGFGWQLLKLFSQRMSGMQRRVFSLTNPDVGTRVGDVLIQLAEESPAHSGAGSTLYVRQIEIGQMAGVTRETVSRLMTEWERRGLLSVCRGRCVIRDLEQFRERIHEPLAIVKP